MVTEEAPEAAPREEEEMKEGGAQVERQQQEEEDEELPIRTLEASSQTLESKFGRCFKILSLCSFW